ncbi:hypothetical protein CEXT_472951 [Caerostris extrusa]|uniref:Uncharacterized protein n=1 Tax=Caerostris extrusa TaxID=172846 RepID=A0AAV4X7F2_CAEEX|nr:hypothetical protein CEXT_472951 [Caerostris extrusa]
MERKKPVLSRHLRGNLDVTEMSNSSFLPSSSFPKERVSSTGFRITGKGGRGGSFRPSVVACPAGGSRALPFLLSLPPGFCLRGWMWKKKTSQKLLQIREALPVAAFSSRGRAPRGKQRGRVLAKLLKQLFTSLPERVPLEAAGVSHSVSGEKGFQEAVQTAPKGILGRKAEGFPQKSHLVYDLTESGATSRHHEEGLPTSIAFAERFGFRRIKSLVPRHHLVFDIVQKCS